MELTSFHKFNYDLWQVYSMVFHSVGVSCFSLASCFSEVEISIMIPFLTYCSKKFMNLRKSTTTKKTQACMPQQLMGYLLISIYIHILCVIVFSLCEVNRLVPFLQRPTNLRQCLSG